MDRLAKIVKDSRKNVKRFVFYSLTFWSKILCKDGYRFRRCNNWEKTTVFYFFLFVGAFFSFKNSRSQEKAQSYDF